MIEAKIDREGLIERIDELLEARYRSADLFNFGEPLEESVFILLSRQTREAVYRRVFAELRHRYRSWLDVLTAPQRELELLLKPAGFHRQRAIQLQALLESIRKANEERSVGPSASPPEDLTLGFLAGMSDEEAERFLVGLPGIGPKSARCVLSYSLDRAAFAVDTHVHRILTRIGAVTSVGRKADHDPFQEAVPPGIRKRLHMNLVHHGREVCRSGNPRCGECVLVSFCERGRQEVSGADRSPVAVDLFAGAGGLGSGFRKAGYEIALAVEAERHAAQTYRLNNPGVPVVEALIEGGTRASSLRKWMPNTGAIDVLLAGPPCQGYSAAGAREPEDPQNQLFEHVARLARQLKADHVILENVPGVRRVNGYGFLHAIVNALEQAGFAVGAHLLRASEFGVPQRRVRYFFVGSRDRRFEAVPAPRPTHRRHGEVSGNGSDLPETLAVTALLNELPLLGSGVDAEILALDDGREFLNMSTMRHSPEVIQRIAAFERGKEPISYRRLDRIEAQTIIAGHRALPVHPIEHRTISVREAAVLQGFPLDYFFCGPRAEQPLQVANAVPPPLATVIASHLSPYLAQPRQRGTASPRADRAPHKFNHSSKRQ